LRGQAIEAIVIEVVEQGELESHEMHEEVEDKDQVGCNGEPLAAEVPGGQPVDPGTRGPEFVFGQLPGERVAMVPELEVLRPLAAEAALRLGKRPQFSIGRDAGCGCSKKYQDGRLHCLLKSSHKLNKYDKYSSN